MFINWILFWAIIVTSSSDKMLEERNITEKLGPPCKDNKMIRALIRYKISSPEDLILLAMEGSKPEVCRDLAVENERVEEYLKHCEPSPEQGLYLSLLSGFRTVKDKLCNNAGFKELLDINQRCYNNVKYEVLSCMGPEDWIEIENTTKLCEIMKSVIGCHYTKTLANCDVFAAEVLNDLMKNIMSSVKEVHCENMVKEAYVRDLRSIVKGSTAKLVPEILKVLITSFILVWK